MRYNTRVIHKKKHVKKRKRSSAVVSFLPATSGGTLPSPTKRAARGAPLDEFTLEGLRNLKRIQSALQLSAFEAAGMLDVTRQAFTEWFTRGVPASKAARVDRIALVVTELAKRFRTQQVPRIAREPLPILDGRTIIDALRTDGAAPIHEMFRRWDAYVPGSDPIRAGECRDA